MTSTKDEVSMKHSLTVPSGHSFRMESTEDMLSVHEVCKAAGISRKTLYHYDHIGLIKPYSHTGKQNGRMYRKEVLGKLETIRIYNNAGLTLKEIDVLVNHSDGRRQDVLQSALARLTDRLAVTIRQIRQLREIMKK